MLCHVCESFDIKALYDFAAETIRSSKPREPGGGGFPEYRGTTDFYAHHNSVRSLLAAANEGCQLCISIWDQFAKNLPTAIGRQETPLPKGEFDEQIYLGLSNWSPIAQGLPYITVTQALPRRAIRNLATFDPYMELGKTPRGFEKLLGRPVSDDSASNACFDLSKLWLNQCLNEHKNCLGLSSDPKRLPSRVIDVGTAATNPRVKETGVETGRWAALSYCWGGDSSFVLASHNKHQFYNGEHPLQAFPQTLQDAIIITKHLGLHYLWVDALCIIQDSPSDWAAEASRMKDVYGGATITIAAAGSNSTQAGVFRHRAVEREVCKLEWRSQLSSESSWIYLRAGLQGSDNKMKAEPLTTRGWTLQELLLSPRTLSYGSQQMTWECLQKRIGEDGRPPPPSEGHKDKSFIQKLLRSHIGRWERSKLKLANLSLNNMPGDWTLVPESWEMHRDMLYSRWFAVLKDFTGRSLTRKKDELPALSGLAVAFNNHLNDQYCAGLWKGDLLRGLLWTRDLLSQNQQQHTAPSSRPIASRTSAVEIGPPSWSWASIAGDRILNRFAEMNTWQDTKVEETAKILDVHTDCKEEDQPFGYTTGGFLIINAPFCIVELNPPETTNPVLTQHIKTEMTLREWRSEFDQQVNRDEKSSFVVIRIMKYLRTRELTLDNTTLRMPGAAFLMLQSEKKDGEWRRVGCFSVSVPMSPDPDDVNVALLEEMRVKKWKWRKFKIV